MKCHCREACCRQSPTSCTLKSIATPKTPHYHTQITHYDCFLILITSGKKCAKATSQLDCIHRRSALQGTAKAQGYALCLPLEAHRAIENISTIALPTSRDAEPRLPPPSPNVSIEVNVNSPNRPTCCTQEHKKPPHARQRKPMRKAAKCLDCPKGWAWGNGLRIYFTIILEEDFSVL